MPDQLIIEGVSPNAIVFMEFHERNPEVYTALLKYARQLVAKRRKRIGIALLFERLRWEVLTETDCDEYKLNNNFRAYYARLLMDRNPELCGLFETREQHHEREEL